MKPMFRAAKVINAEKMRAQLDNGSARGEADILVSVFGVPDSGVAYGNTEPQVIDNGAFRSWLAEADARDRTVYIDHGDALVNGVHSARLAIGVVDSAEETEDGLLLHTRYNLEKQVGREAFSDLQFNPEGAQFSFGWNDAKTQTYRSEDGTEHVKELWPIEFSQVARGAQKLAGLVAARSEAAMGARAEGDRLEGVSLEAIPSQVRRAWHNQHEAIKVGMGGYAWIEEVYDTYVVVSVSGEDEEFAQVPWSRNDDGDITFDLANRTPLRREFVAARGELLVPDFKSPQGKRALASAMVEDESFALDMQRSADEALADRTSFGEDVAFFYRDVLDVH